MSVQKVSFKNKEGQNLSGRLELPLNQKAHNFVLFAHCFTCNKNLLAIKNISRSLTAVGFGVLRFVVLSSSTLLLQSVAVFLRPDAQWARTQSYPWWPEVAEHLSMLHHCCRPQPQWQHTTLPLRVGGSATLETPFVSVLCRICPGRPEPDRYPVDVSGKRRMDNATWLLPNRNATSSETGSRR